MTLEKAIEILNAEYEQAKKQPLAYAMYHTWKKVDEKLNNKRKERGKKWRCS